MAFSESRRHSLAEELRCLEQREQELEDKLQQPDQQQRSGGRVPNLARKMAVALRQTYVEIDATRSFPSSRRTSTLPTDEWGHLLVGSSFPILLRRYRLLRQLGQGSFSQIFRAADLFHGKEVAIKVMRIGYGTLGRREGTMLRCLARSTAKGCQYYAAYLDSFEFEGHHCLVLPLYQGTLLHLLACPTSAPAAAAAAVLPPDMTFLHQPKVVRPTSTGGRLASSGHSLGGTPLASSGMGMGMGIGVSMGSVMGMGAPGTRPSPVLSSHSVDARGLSNVRSIAISLLSSLYLLRLEGVVHADIKPENCFLRRVADAPLGNGSGTGVGVGVGGGAGGAVASVMSGSDESICLEGASLNDIVVDNTLDAVSAAGRAVFALHLGDLGNAIHKSEASQYYEDFQIQSLPYRAPEVLLGLPFGPAIDAWSVGVLLLELLTGQTLFRAESREEQLKAISRRIYALSPVCFSGGKFAHLLSEDAGMGTGMGSAGAGDQYSAAAHCRSVRRILTRALPAERHWLLSSDLVHFLCALLRPDPRARATPLEALAHPFLCRAIPVPAALLTGAGAGMGAQSRYRSASISAVRRTSGSSSSMRSAASVASAEAGRARKAGAAETAVAVAAASIPSRGRDTFPGDSRDSRDSSKEGRDSGGDRDCSRDSTDEGEKREKGEREEKREKREKGEKRAEGEREVEFEEKVEAKASAVGNSSGNGSFGGSGSGSSSESPEKERRSESKGRERKRIRESPEQPQAQPPAQTQQQQAGTTQHYTLPVNTSNYARFSANKYTKFQ
ncbi:kinase-like domain-containing protein [Ochromonadaceae sp. CCMP2298]|nr:kinase-like domain-containing protein [Ochromonadaceae sp. CCMP2298]